MTGQLSREGDQSAPTVVAIVDGRELERAGTDRRLAALRSGPLSALVPAGGSAEGRQLARWAAQVEIVVALCSSEAVRRGLRATAGPARQLDSRAAVELGSVVAAAWQASQAVRAVGEHVGGADLASVPGSSGEPLASPPAREVRLRHRLEPTEAAAHAVMAGAQARLLAPMGWARAEELPPALGALVADAGLRPGTWLGPARSSLGWHVVVVEGCRVRTMHGPLEGSPRPDAAEARRRFLRWLASERSGRVVSMPGFEHPGDPRQPDNYHRH